jgi:hypothetical protein
LRHWGERSHQSLAGLLIQTVLFDYMFSANFRWGHSMGKCGKEGWNGTELAWWGRRLAREERRRLRNEEEQSEDVHRRGCG